MIRSELIQKLSREFDDLPYSELEGLVKILFERVITEALGVGRRVEIRGFGSFKSKFMPAKMARNPKKGVLVQTQERYTVHFKSGKALRDKVNKATGLLEDALLEDA